MFTLRWRDDGNPSHIRIRVFATEAPANKLLTQLGNDPSVTLISAEGWKD